MSNSIDCSGHNEVTFKFEQAYRAFNHDKTYVEVSTNGGASWQQATDINPSVSSNANATETVVYRNFNVNGSPTVKFRFRWENNNNSNQYGSGYAWQVDDVEVSTLTDHDIAIKNYYYGTTGSIGLLHYYQIPITQNAPIEGSAILKNQGSQDQSNVTYSASETVNNVYSASSIPTTLLSGSSDSILLNMNFTPSTLGDYELNYSISYNNTDDNPLNNTVEPYKFTVTQSIYARDSSSQAEIGTVYSQMSGSNLSPAQPIEAGNAFDIVSNTKLTGIDFQFGDLIPPGEDVFGVVYDSNLDFVANGETLPYQVVAGDENSYQTLVFSTPLNLVAGETYIVVVRCYDPNLSIAVAGESAPQTTFVYYVNEATWYYTTSTPVVRMNFAPVVTTSKSSISGFSHIIGTPSTAESFNVAGYNLSGDVTVTAPTNFEVANAVGGPYSQNITLTQSNGALPSTTVYVRLNGPVENLNQAGDVVISSNNAVDKTVAVTGKTMAECNVDVAVSTNQATITANASGLVYQWFDCDDNMEISGETGQSYTATENGNYAVIITDGPCIDTSICVFIDNVGLYENDFNGIAVYPNPVKEVLKITSENGGLKSVEIVTAAGKVVYTSAISSNDFEINTAQLSSGVYFVNLRTDKGAKTYKIIK